MADWEDSLSRLYSIVKSCDTNVINLFLPEALSAEADSWTLSFTGYQEIQTFVFKEHEVDEIEVEEAVTYYSKRGNTDLQRISDEIEKVFVMFGGKVGKNPILTFG